MAGKTKDMSQIKQLLLLKKEGVSNRKAAEIVGINKETANNYVRKALADRLGIDGLLKLDDPVLEHRLKGGNPAYTDSRFEVFKELLPYLQEEMRRKHVTLKLLWEEYVEEHPDDHYSLTQFRFHYSQNTEAKKESPSTVLAGTCARAVRSSSLTSRVTRWGTSTWRRARWCNARLLLQHFPQATTASCSSSRHSARRTLCTPSHSA